MVDSIHVTLTPDTLKALPSGEATEATVTIQNTGTAVDQYAVELDGLPTTWYTLSNESVALFPQDREEAKIVIRPPKGNGVKAGAYPFTVTVLSRADATQTSRAEGTLEIGAVAAFELDMSPKKVIGRKGRYTLTMRNGGNADLDVEMELINAEDALRYSFKPETPHLAAGQQVTTRLTVKARRSNLVGVRKQLDFQVKAKPSQGEPKQMQGQLVHTPRFGTWKPIRRLVYLIVILAVLALAVSALGGTRGTATQASSWKNSAAHFACTRLHVLCGLETAAARLVPGNHVHQHTHGRFIGEFRDFHIVDPHLIGEPMENEHSAPGGFVIQKTTHGLLLFDPRDHVQAFFIPDGMHVYTYGQHGAHRFNGGL